MTVAPRIPRGIDDCSQYLVSTNNYLNSGTPTNAERLGILPAEVTQWSDLASRFHPLFLLYSDKKNSRTTAVKDQLLSIIDELTDLDQTCHLLDRIAASPNVTIVDMETFNIKKGVLQKTTRTVAITPLTNQVAAAFQPIGGGSLNIKCRNLSGERPGIDEGANCVQYAFRVGGAAPVSADAENLRREISTRASFVLALGSASSAQNLFIYFRWYNTKHPEIAGPWSALMTTLIL
jgi:hypothetical protein